jgi:hypothetical protein
MYTIYHNIVYMCIVYGNRSLLLRNKWNRILIADKINTTGYPSIKINTTKYIIIIHLYVMIIILKPCVDKDPKKQYKTTNSHVGIFIVGALVN